MKPLDYLRARARRDRTPATGGIIQPADHPPTLPTGYLVPTTQTKPTEEPTGIIIDPTPLTHERAQQLRQDFQAALSISPRVRGDALPCPCAVIYSRCHYPDKHGRLPH